MPKWIHDRARHLQAKNPEMPESQAFAIATQQSHAVGKSPKGYGTAEGRREAKAKYDTPSDDKKTADPRGVGREFEKDSGKSKIARLLPFLDGFIDELTKIANLGAMGAPATVSDIKSTIPRNTMKAGVAKYSKVNSDMSESRAQMHQPVLSPPPVRG